MDLQIDLIEKTKQLELSIKELRNSGTNYATAERDYKIKLREECLRLRDEGMAITLIDKVAYGIPSVAEARFKRDVAQTIYTANQEAINSLKLQLRLIDGQINREWGANLKD